VGTATHVLIYALAAAVSPLVLAATFVVVRSARPRPNGVVFLSGFLLGTIIACTLGLLLGSSLVNRLGSHDTIAGGIALLLGVALLVVGLRTRQAPPPRASPGSRRSAIMAGLAGVRPSAAFSLAGLLGFGGPKRLVLTVLAMASVSETDLGDIADATLVIIYVAVATVLVWVPVGIVIVAGERAEAILTRGGAWVTARAVPLRRWLSVAVGAALVIDGLLRLSS
jgi:hypothetical protein